MSLQIPSEHGFMHPDFFELAAYLGPQFRLDWCNSNDSKGHEEAQRYSDNLEFMRNTDIFCFQNIGLCVQGIHRPYIAKIMELSADKGGVSFLEVGAAGGQLGLALHTLGFRVSFADIYSRSILWLLWRLHGRRLNLPVYILEDGWDKIPHHQIASAFDVIEHLSPEDQIGLLENLAATADTVLVNLIRGDGSELEGLHFEVDIDGLTQYCEEHWKTAHFDFYPDESGVPRQRLLVYGPRLVIVDE